MIYQHIELIFLFGVIAAALNWLAYSKGFYHYIPVEGGKTSALTLRQVVLVFLIYLATMLGLMPLLARLFPPLYMFGSFIAALFLFLYCRAQDHSLMKKIWKDRNRPNTRSIFFDIGFGIMAWVIAFPVVACIGQIVDLFVYLAFGVVTYEQVAVRYLRTVLADPSLLAMALILILVVAPFIEEFLFRGCLQTWFKKHLGPKAAILLAALCFACFHISPSQGIGNISLVISLFSFACYLGFVYERQGSLFASVGLHMAFNAISTIRILFTSES